MVRVIAYDIASPKRLRRVAKTCLDYGIRIEKSVFECDLNDSQFAELWVKLKRITVANEDSLVAYSMCKKCENGVLTEGLTVRPQKVDLYIF